jgi:hypothetical protein
MGSREGWTVLEWLTTTEYADWVRESWGWPLALTIHAFGTATVVGFIFIIGLRLFGLFRTIPYASLNSLFPFIWIAIALQIMSGFTLWMSKPAQYLAAGMFDVKITFVIIGIIVTAFFQGTIKREAPAWEKAGKVSSRGLKFVAAAVMLWTAVNIAGRLTAYLTSLYVA